MESERRSERVMAVRVGRFSRNPAEACNTQLFFDEATVRTTTLISELKFQMILNRKQFFFIISSSAYRLKITAIQGSKTHHLELLVTVYNSNVV